MARTSVDRMPSSVDLPAPLGLSSSARTDPAVSVSSTRRQRAVIAVTLADLLDDDRRGIRYFGCWRYSVSRLGHRLGLARRVLAAGLERGQLVEQRVEARGGPAMPGLGRTSANTVPSVRSSGAGPPAGRRTVGHHHASWGRSWISNCIVLRAGS
ncbi:MAG: hypothetical protein IPH80_41570 [Myxococcales bacterium]|nr:hypothetical protein [Myxococcales bacterium]